MHEYKAGTPAEKVYFVELWDVGGWSAHKNSRSIFYNPLHGQESGRIGIIIGSSYLIGFNPVYVEH